MRRLTEAYHGSSIYKKLKKNKDNVFFLFLLDNDPELNYYAIAHANRYAELMGFASMEIICSNNIADSLPDISENKYAVTSLSEKQADHLLSYILLKSNAMGLPLLKNIRLISLYRSNNGIDMLFSKNVFDKEYLVWEKMLFYPISGCGELLRITPFNEVHIP